MFQQVSGAVHRSKASHRKGTKLEEEEGLESNSGDSSYDQEESMDEVVQCYSTPVAGIKSAGEYDTPIVSLVEGNTGNKSKTKVSSNDTKNTVIRSSGKYVFLFVVFFLYHVYFS
jgi:flavoprotein